MPLIAITGGVATGKSTFTKCLRNALSAESFDTDQSARELLEKDPEVQKEILAEFGDSVVSEGGARIHRGALREVVFENPAKRRALESILHPRIRRTWQHWADQRLQTEPKSILLVEIPLLFEAGLEEYFDYNVVVACGIKSQMQRLVEHRGLSAKMARRIIESQMDLTEKIRRAASVIWNEGNVENGLGNQVSICASFIKVGHAQMPPC